MLTIDGSLSEYWTWLREKTTVRELGEWAEITTPFLDRHNDHLQIYARQENGRLILTDDGYTIADLELSGCSLDTPKRQALLSTALNGFGVRNANGALEVTASPTDFPSKKHNLIQAMLATNDLFYLASPTVESVFYEDVVGWLDDAGVRYTPDVKFTGASGYDHRFDFVIPKSRERPERVLRAINRADRQTAQALAFAWIDTRDVRAEDSRAYAVLNDQERGVSGEVVDAIRAYGVEPIHWTLRRESESELVA